MYEINVCVWNRRFTNRLFGETYLLFEIDFKGFEDSRIFTNSERDVMN